MSVILVLIYDGWHFNLYREVAVAKQSCEESLKFIDPPHKSFYRTSTIDLELIDTSVFHFEAPIILC
jgi:hypothetical protein